jgi:hypothetical protein
VQTNDHISSALLKPDFFRFIKKRLFKMRKACTNQNVDIIDSLKIAVF